MIPSKKPSFRDLVCSRSHLCGMSSVVNHELLSHYLARRRPAGASRHSIWFTTFNGCLPPIIGPPRAGRTSECSGHGDMSPFDKTGLSHMMLRNTTVDYQETTVSPNDTYLRSGKGRAGDDRN